MKAQNITTGMNIPKTGHGLICMEVLILELTKTKIEIECVSAQVPLETRAQRLPEHHYNLLSNI